MSHRPARQNLKNTPAGTASTANAAAMIAAAFAAAQAPGRAGLLKKPASAKPSLA